MSLGRWDFFWKALASYCVGGVRKQVPPCNLDLDHDQPWSLHTSLIQHDGGISASLKPIWVAGLPWNEMVSSYFKLSQDMGRRSSRTCHSIVRSTQPRPFVSLMLCGVILLSLHCRKSPLIVTWIMDQDHSALRLHQLESEHDSTLSLSHIVFVPLWNVTSFLFPLPAFCPLSFCPIPSQHCQIWLLHELLLLLLSAFLGNIGLHHHFPQLTFIGLVHLGPLCF